VSPCSGHGFKFAPVIGDIVADLALNGGTDAAIEMFSPGRFSRVSRLRGGET
jgi:sarcosine oxidase